MVDVESDGITVRLNKNGHCVAIFSSACREYNVHWKIPQLIRHANGCPTQDDWDAFVSVAEESFDIIIGSEYRPSYIKANAK